MVLRRAGESTRVGVEDKVEVTAIRHHPRYHISVALNRNEDSKVWSDERGGVARVSCPSLVDWKDTELGLIEYGAVPTAWDIEFLDECLAKGTGKLGTMGVVAKFFNPIRIEEDMNVIGFEFFGPRLAGAAFFAFHWLRVGRCRPEHYGKQNKSDLPHDFHHLDHEAFSVDQCITRQLSRRISQSSTLQNTQPRTQDQRVVD